MPISRSSLAAGAARLLPQGVVDFAYRHRFHPVLRRLRAAFPSAAGDPTEGLPIARGPLTGMRFAHRDSFAMWLGRHEPAVQDLIESDVQPGQVAYDVGAHVGYMAMLLARRVGGSGAVVAFEPVPASLELLHRNVELNGLTQVTVREVGLGEQVGRASIDDREQSAEIQIVASDAGAIEVSTLDREVYELGQPPPHWVMLDTEGLEAPILRGGRRVLEEHRPRLLVEHHNLLADVLALVEPLGYRVRTVDVEHVLLDPS